MNEAGLDNVASGANADLVDPMGWALRQSDYSVATIGQVSSADLAGVAEADYDKVFDLAEYRALLNTRGNLTAVDIKVGPRSESYSQLGGRLEALIKSKAADLERDYSFGLATLEAGVIALNYTDDDNA